jgi:hypothetical protein
LKKIIQYFLQKELGKKRKKIGKSGNVFPLLEKNVGHRA